MWIKKINSRNSWCLHHIFDTRHKIVKIGLTWHDIVICISWIHEYSSINIGWFQLRCVKCCLVDSVIHHENHYLWMGDYVFGSVGLFVYLSVSMQHYSTSYEWIMMNFDGGSDVVKGTTWLHFGGNPDHHADCPIRNLAIAQQIAITSGICWNFQDSSAMIQGTIYWILGLIWITMLTLQIANLGNMGHHVGDLCFLSALVHACYY